jgi:uncharacterized phiE125 gp8 family phage protein
MLTTLVAPSPPFDETDQALRQMLRLEASETEQDTLIVALIAASVASVEAFLRRKLVTQTVQLTLDGFLCGARGEIALPVTPVQTVDQVNYVDADGISQTLAASEYEISRSGVTEKLILSYDGSWPVVRDQSDAVQIDLVVGYGDTAADIPADILHAVRLNVAHMFDVRPSDAPDRGDPAMPSAVRSHLNRHRAWF